MLAQSRGSGANKIYGVVPGKVASLPDDLGRVKVRLDFLGGENETYWAPVGVQMSGKDRGSWIMPVVGDDVIVAFEQGNADKPYIVGCMWNGEEKPPSSDPQVRLIRSVNGHEIEIYDPDVAAGDTGYVRISDAHGNEIVLANAAISLRSVGTIIINAPNVIINNRPVAPDFRPI
jgi:uncharacterized protein involved in type VI secretion and phage assembly